MTREEMEYRDVLKALKVVLETSNGKVVFKYLFKNFMVGKLPDTGLTGHLMREALGFYRAGQSIFELTTAADTITSSKLLAELRREELDVEEILSVNE